jgi:mannose PTS system EIID component
MRDGLEGAVEPGRQGGASVEAEAREGPTGEAGHADGLDRIGGLDRLRVFIRSFAIQGSWNERTMQGGGFGFALLPGLRALYRDDPAELSRAVRRHVEHFNAHPYLAELALGAVLRLEAERTPPDEIRRFKAAVRGPLGSIGDVLVWAGWLPACALLAVAAGLAGAGPWVTVLLFLGVYNLGHLVLRGWVFRAGLREGREVGRWLRGAQLSHHSATVARVGTVLLGVVLGLAIARGIHGEPVPAPLLVLSGFLLAAGAHRGLELRRWSWFVFLSAILLFLLVGALR